MRALNALVLCCVSSSVRGVRPPPPPTFELDGACAGVKQRETWKSAKGQPNWSYRIKINPWTVFGKIRVQLHGWDMAVSKNYSAAVPASAGRDFVAVLHPQPGFDNTFQIQGTGEPYADPDLSCEGLVERNSSLSECPLGPYFSLESDWASLQNGRIRAAVEVNLWVLQTIITLDFGTATKVTLGRDMYGARLTDGGRNGFSRAHRKRAHRVNPCAILCCARCCCWGSRPRSRCGLAPALVLVSPALSPASQPDAEESRCRRSACGGQPSSWRRS